MILSLPSFGWEILFDGRTVSRYNKARKKPQKEGKYMKIITISREFGSGGRELGKRLSDILGFDYYDREIIAAIAEAKGLDENYVEKALESGVSQRVPLTFHNSFSTIGMMQSAHISLLQEQTRVIEGIAKRGKDCVIVGRNADILLADQKPFTIFVCASMEAKIKRCQERAREGEQLTEKEIEQNIKRINKNRAQNYEMIAGRKWGQAASYNITVNTSEWDIKELTPAVAAFARRWFEHNAL